MDDIRQEIPNKDLILKLNKRLKQMALNELFGTHVKESMAFQALKNKQYSIPLLITCKKLSSLSSKKRENPWPENSF